MPLPVVPNYVSCPQYPRTSREGAQDKAPGARATKDYSHLPGLIRGQKYGVMQRRQRKDLVCRDQLHSRGVTSRWSRGLERKMSEKQLSLFLIDEDDADCGEVPEVEYQVACLPHATFQCTIVRRAHQKGQCCRKGNLNRRL